MPGKGKPTLPRRKCVFNDELKRKYPFLRNTKSESDVYCSVCNSDFSIANAGKSDIERHIQKDKHVKANNASANSRSVSVYYSSKIDYKVSRYEGVWTYHNIKSNQSCNSSECASKIFRTCFEIYNFHCGRTKIQAIARNVFGPFAIDMLKTELSKVSYVSLLTDASTHGNTKMMPVLVRFFSPTKGAFVKMLDLTTQKGETSKIISDLVKTTAQKNEIVDKLVAFCADNCPTNFGSADRGGNNNVYYHLRQWRPSLLGMGCAANIVHNALKHASDLLPIDIENIVVKIYSKFYRSTLQVEALKALCKDADVNYTQLLGYSSTRFLALASSVGSILKVFEPLKTYFLELPRCNAALKTFFESRLAKLWLLFIKDQVNKIILLFRKHLFI